MVVNDDLMGNHQLELASRLAQDHHLVHCMCQTLADAIRNFNKADLVPFPSGEAHKFGHFIDNLFD